MARRGDSDAFALEIAPESIKGGMIEIPEFIFFGCTKTTFSGLARSVGAFGAVGIEKIGDADLIENVFFGEVFGVKFGGIFIEVMGNNIAIWAGEVGVEDIVIFGVWIAESHRFIPDFFDSGGVFVDT